MVRTRVARVENFGKSGWSLLLQYDQETGGKLFLVKNMEKSHLPISCANYVAYISEEVGLAVNGFYANMHLKCLSRLRILRKGSISNWINQ